MEQEFNVNGTSIRSRPPCPIIRPYSALYLGASWLPEAGRRRSVSANLAALGAAEAARGVQQRESSAGAAMRLAMAFGLTLTNRRTPCDCPKATRNSKKCSGSHPPPFPPSAGDRVGKRSASSLYAGRLGCLSQQKAPPLLTGLYACCSGFCASEDRQWSVRPFKRWRGTMHHDAVAGAARYRVVAERRTADQRANCFASFAKVQRFSAEGEDRNQAVFSVPSFARRRNNVVHFYALCSGHTRTFRLRAGSAVSWAVVRSTPASRA